jgi:hypothetical protein
VRATAKIPFVPRAEEGEEDGDVVVGRGESVGMADGDVVVGRGEIVGMADGDVVVGRGEIVGMADGEDEVGEEDGVVVGRSEVDVMADGENDGDRVSSGVAVGIAELEGIGAGSGDIVGDMEGIFEGIGDGSGDVDGGTSIEGAGDDDSSITRSIVLIVEEQTMYKKEKRLGSLMLKLSIGKCALSPRQQTSLPFFRQRQARMRKLSSRILGASAILSISAKNPGGAIYLAKVRYSSCSTRISPFASA